MFLLIVKVLVVIFMLCCALFIKAQDPQKEFDQFKSRTEVAFEQARQEQDSIFARAMLENWKAIHLQPPIEKEIAPKPEKQPQADSTLELKEVKHQILETQPKLMRSFRPPSLEYTQEYEPNLLEEYSFYGSQIQVKYADEFLIATRLEIDDQNDLAKAWKLLSKLPYQSVISDLFKQREDLKLPDYGYLLLIDSFLDQLQIKDAQKAVYSWFLLQKSGFVSRVGLIEEFPVLIIGSYGKIYGKRYYSSVGINYYLLSDKQGELESYIVEADADNNPFDLSIKQPVELPLSPVEKTISYTAKAGGEVSCKVIYNQQTVELLGQFPQVELAYYLSSTSSDLLDRSMEVALKPYLEELSDIEKVDFLLEFVQKGFDYQSDSKQFGRERVMYPEEIFFYPQSDCDDRVVLLAYLLKKFVDVPVIAVSFPQHVTLAVKMTSPIFGETIKYNGYDFTLCDPTYFNGPIGSVIPSADRSEMTVIEF